MARRQEWQVGDVFLVLLSNGKLVPGQIVGREAHVLNSVTVAFFDEPQNSMDEFGRKEGLDPTNVFSVVFSTRDLLDSGQWKVVGNRDVRIPNSILPYEDLRPNGFIGATVTGSGILNEFLNAFYGLVPWDDWKDPKYLDELLVSPAKKPSERLRYKRAETG